LIAREREYLQSTILVLLIQGLQLVVVILGQASCACHVDHNTNFANKLTEINLLSAVQSLC
jgi:hypothetical protein